jgi:hypothetical protein
MNHPEQQIHKTIAKHLRLRGAARRRSGHRTVRLSGRVTSASNTLGAWHKLGDVAAAMLRRRFGGR